MTLGRLSWTDSASWDCGRKTGTMGGFGGRMFLTGESFVAAILSPFSSLVFFLCDLVSQ